MYKVKIVNPKRIGDMMLRQLHNSHGKCESMVGLRTSLIKELKDMEKLKKNFSHNRIIFGI